MLEAKDLTPTRGGAGIRSCQLHSGKLGHAAYQPGAKTRQFGLGVGWGGVFHAKEPGEGLGAQSIVSFRGANNVLGLARDDICTTLC